MAAKRVRAGAKYRYVPVMWDKIDPPYGVKNGTLEPGGYVRVVNLPGCPKSGTMGMSHIESVDGVFLGLVSNNSLLNEKEYREYKNTNNKEIPNVHST